MIFVRNAPGFGIVCDLAVFAVQECAVLLVHIILAGAASSEAKESGRIPPKGQSLNAADVSDLADLNTFYQLLDDIISSLGKGQTVAVTAAQISTLIFNVSDAKLSKPTQVAPTHPLHNFF